MYIWQQKLGIQATYSLLCIHKIYHIFDHISMEWIERAIDRKVAVINCYFISIFDSAYYEANLHVYSDIEIYSSKIFNCNNV